MTESSPGDLVGAVQAPPGGLVALRRGLIIGVFVLQFMIPFIALVGSPAPSRLGFQMYSGQGDLSAYFVDASGDRQTIDVDDLVANARTEIDWISKLSTTYVCDAYPDAVTVVLSQVNSHGTRTARHQCPS